jgi:hypothetical protein
LAAAFGSDPNLLGKTVSLDDRNLVVGIMRRFVFPG